MWYRFDEPPMLDDGTMDPLAVVVLADTMPGAVGEKIGPQEGNWFAPSVDLTVHLLDDCRSPWLLNGPQPRARTKGRATAARARPTWRCGTADGR